MIRTDSPKRQFSDCLFSKSYSRSVSTILLYSLSA